ncbi:MAG TPA: ThuA domain-containing protein [Fibrobacteria bacterium]|nr:ThuA domain-containing protein [Fibrobacteria bacterium]
MKRLLQLVVAVAFVCATCVHAAPVAPNPKSLLKNKRVLVVQATNWNGKSHETPKANGLAKLNLIRTAVGITNFTVVDNVENYTAAVLNNYDIIVFNYVFNSQVAVGKPFEKAFRTWIESGNKGWVGYHTSGANDVGEWPWYRDTVTCMRYHAHSTAAQQGVMTKTKDPAILAHPIMAGMDSTFTGTDEWYDFDLAPRGNAPDGWANARVTYYLDESTLSTNPTRPMNPHPMAWYREDKWKNRFYYSGFIHSDAGSNSDFFHSSILRGMEYVAGYDSSGADITSFGNSIRTLEKLTYITNSKQLRVDIPGSYKLSIFSSKGGLVDIIRGEGFRTYGPESFKKPGIYFVKLQSKVKNFTQKMMIY